MNLHEHTKEVHEGGHHRGRNDGLIRHVQEFNHQERGRTQNWRRNLTPRRGGCLHCCCKVFFVAHANHGGNGERTHCHGVGHRRTTQHAKQGRAKHTDLGGAARITTRNARGHIQEQLTQANARGHHAKQHKVKNIGGHHTHRHTINALAGEVLVVDHHGPIGTSMLEQTWKVRAKQSVNRETNGNEWQGPAHGPPCGFEQGDEQDAAHDDVHVAGVAHAEHQVIKDVGNVENA